MNILIYYQSSSRTIFLESLAQNFIQKGHTVFFLTITSEGILHQKMKELGAMVAGQPVNEGKRFKFISHWRFLIRYCRDKKIDVVFSHLQTANLIAVVAQYFIRGKVYPCRHHVDEVMLVGNKNGMLGDMLISRLAKKIIVVSNAAKRQMTGHENIKEDKVMVIPLGYDFNLYDKPDPATVLSIREEMKCRLLLIVIARMSVNKRHIVALQALSKLVNEGLDVKMLLLDRGPEEANLKEFVKANSLDEKAFFTGFLNNTMDYVAAADLVLHPSIIEASNQVVKEAAIVGVPSIVCRGIGDFDEYFIHGENGLLVSKENTCEEMYEIVKEYYFKRKELKTIGENMKEEVLRRFDINNISDDYNRVLDHVMQYK